MWNFWLGKMTKTANISSTEGWLEIGWLGDKIYLSYSYVRRVLQWNFNCLISKTERINSKNAKLRR